MCGGGGGSQTVTQKTEIDPELRRLLYGGALTSAHGLRNGFGGSTGGLLGIGSLAGGGGDPGGGAMWSDGMSPSQISAERSAGTFGSGMPDSSRGQSYSPSSVSSADINSGGMYAMGGPVQAGIASMQPNMPMTQNMPMMNGMLPNLSDPEIAATLAMAQMRPQMMMGRGKGAGDQAQGMPHVPALGFADGGSVSRLSSGLSPLASLFARRSLSGLLGREEGQPIPVSEPRQYTPRAQPIPENPALVDEIVQRSRAQYFADGGYIEGPGTGTSDSIPAAIHQNGIPVQKAALSDGEFVMTERAVRGAGEGDREKGAARMYEMMRMFERGGRV
jgi:hypothetical protein